MMYIYTLFKNYGNYTCNIEKLMDQARIIIFKIEQFTGLYHNIVKKYYNDQIQRIKDVLAKIIYANSDRVDLISSNYLN